MFSYSSSTGIMVSSEAPCSMTVEKPKAKKRYHEKTKGGCLTCKARRVKCGEEKPYCRRCRTAKRLCAGYANVVVKVSHPEERTWKLQDQSSHSTTPNRKDFDSSGSEKTTSVSPTILLKSVLQPSSGVIDPFFGPVIEDHQEFVDSVLKFTVRVIWPQLASEKTHPEWLQAVLQSPMLLAVNIWGHGLLYKYHISYFDPGKTKCLTAFQAKTAKLAGEELEALVEDPDRVPSDELIVVVTMLASYPDMKTGRKASCNSIATMQHLDYFGHADANKHDKALASLLARKGGLEKIGIKEYANCVALRDLVLATLSLQKPQHPPWFVSPFPSHENATIPDDSALCGIERDLAFVILDIQKLVRILSGEEAAGNLDTVEISSARASIHYRLLSLEPSALRTAIIIFSDIAICPLPPSKGIRSKLVEDFDNRPWDFGDNLPLKLWATSMAAMVANWDHLPTLLVEVRDTCTHLKVESFKEFKQVLKQYLWWDDTCDGLGRTLWQSIPTSNTNE